MSEHRPSIEETYAIIEAYTPEKLDEIFFSADWKIVLVGIEIKTGTIPKFVISSEIEIEEFFKTVGLNAFNLPGNKGNFDVRYGLIDFVPEESKKKFSDKLKHYGVLNND